MGTVSFEVPGPGTYQVQCDPSLPALPSAGSAADVLAGKQFYNAENGAVTGTMPDNGAVDVSLAAGGSYTVPAGYHNGQGKVKSTASPLPALTNPGTAADLLKDKQLIDGTGNVVTGTMEPVSPTYAGILVVTVDAGSVVTATDGTTTLTETSNGTATFTLPNGGTWTVSAVLNGNHSPPETATVQENFTATLSPGGSTSVTVPTQYTAELSFLPTYTITLNIAPAESGTVTGAGTYQEGSLVTVSAAAAEGYEFSQWTETGASRLPTGYQELEYIQSSGTQYINTGYIPKNSTRISAKFQFLSTSSNFFSIFGVEGADGYNGYMLFGRNGQTGVQGIYGGQYFSVTGANYSTTSPDTVEWENNSVQFDGIVQSLTASTFTCDAPIYLFGSDKYTTSGTSQPQQLISARFYSFQAYDDGTFVRNFIPCTDPSGDVGLYDLVDGQFYANAGTGDFTAGPAVGGGTVVSTEPTYTFTVTGDRTLMAEFEEGPQYEAGVDWWAATLPSYEKWYSVTYGGGKFVTVAGSSNQAAYSTNGITWTAATLPSSAFWYSVTYGGGKFVTVASSSNQAAYSTNGITWTAATLPSSASWTSVAYGNGIFVAVASRSDKVAYSTDGETWKPATLPSSANWSSITYGGGKFVIVASGSEKVVYGTNGSRWSSANMPSSQSWSGLTYGNGTFLAIASNGKAATSYNGYSWYSATLPSSANWSGPTYGDGKFLIVPYNGDKAAYSKDGRSWSWATLPSSTFWESVTYGDGKFVTVALSSNKAAYSSAKGPGA